MSFHETLRKIRLEKQLSQTELAELLSIDRSVISKWENGTRSPTIDQAKQIADALGISVSELIGEIPSVQPDKTISSEQKDYITFFCLLLLAVTLLPWSIPLPIAAIILQNKKHFPKPYYLISFAILFLCIYEFVLIDGIYVIIPLIRQHWPS